MRISNPLPFRGYSRRELAGPTRKHWYVAHVCTVWNAHNPSLRLFLAQLRGATTASSGSVYSGSSTVKIVDVITYYKNQISSEEGSGYFLNFRTYEPLTSVSVPEKRWLCPGVFVT